MRIYFHVLYDVKKGAMTSLEEFLDKISPLKRANKLGAILFQLPPNFTVHDFKNIEEFLDRLPTNNSYDYAIEFRHPSWGTEGPWEMLEHYNIAAVDANILVSNIRDDVKGGIICHCCNTGFYGVMIPVHVSQQTFNYFIISNCQT